MSTDAFRAAIDRGWWSYAAQLVAASDDDGEGVDAALYEQLAEDVAMANHRPYLRGFTHAFHYARCFIYTRTTDIST